MVCFRHETINIHLKKKPEWYFDINPKGKVPSIEKNGDILIESDITSGYVDAAYGGKKLTTTDPLKHAQELIVLAYFNDVSGQEIIEFFTLELTLWSPSVYHVFLRKCCFVCLF